MSEVPKRQANGVWVVVTACNERLQIGGVLDDLLLSTKNIVVVDDGSSDSTAGEVLKRPVWLLRHAVNLGQGAAVQTGLAFALQQQANTSSPLTPMVSTPLRIFPCSSNDLFRQAPILPSARDF